MTATLLYRVASALLVLFAAGHTFGFLAFLAWHLGNLARTNPPAIGGLGWAFFAVQVAILVLSWIYFFTAPIVFSGLVAACAGGAAWLVRLAP